jgi:hypothetical protein
MISANQSGRRNEGVISSAITLVSQCADALRTLLAGISAGETACDKVL